MAPSKLAILVVFLALIFSQIRADIELPPPVDRPSQSGGPGGITTEHERNTPGKTEVSPYKAYCHFNLGGWLNKLPNRGGKKEQKKNGQRNEVSPEEYEKNQKRMEHQLKNDDTRIKGNEKVIQQKSNIISSLRSEIESLQKNGSLVEQQVRKAEAHADELEKKINELEQKLQSQHKEKEDLESRVNKAEEKINDLLSEIENARKANDEQETKIRKTEHALEVKVAEVNKLEKELQSQRVEKGDLKDRVNEAVKKIDDLLSKIESVNKLEKELQSQRSEKGNLKDWVNEVEKKIDDLLSKIEIALEKKAQAEKWAEPYVETTKTVNELEKELHSQRIEKGDLKDRVNEAVKKIDDLLSKIESVNKLEKELQSQRSEKGNLKDWVNEAEKKIDDLLSKIENALDKKAHVETTKTIWIPAIKEQWVVVKETVELHVISLSNKTIEVFEVSKTTLAPHVIKAQEVVDLYFQEAKKFGKPYVDQLTTVTKPHVDKAVIAYEKFLKSASIYHHQVQGTVKDLLKRHELTRPLATKELEWFAAPALVALLIIILFRIFSSLFCTKTKKPVPGTNHARRKAKRGHPETLMHD